MSRIEATIVVVALLVAATSAQAHSVRGNPNDGNIQSYGAHWRYQHREWSRPGSRMNPGVCWQRSDDEGEWVWTC